MYILEIYPANNLICNIHCVLALRGRRSVSDNVVLAQSSLRSHSNNNCTHLSLRCTRQTPAMLRTRSSIASSSRILDTAIIRGHGNVPAMTITAACKNYYKFIIFILKYIYHCSELLLSTSISWSAIIGKNKFIFVQFINTIVGPLVMNGRSVLSYELPSTRKLVEICQQYSTW